MSETPVQDDSRPTMDSPFSDRPFEMSAQGDALRIACPTEPSGGPWEDHYDTQEKLIDLGLSRLLQPPR